MDNDMDNDMDDNVIAIKMTRQQLEYLVEILGSAQDEGPSGAGWQSKRLEALQVLFETELNGLGNS